MQTDKNRWRKDLKRLRQEIPGSLRKQNNLDIRRNLLSLQGLGDAKSIFCFVSYGAEVDTHGIIDELLRQGKQLAVPKITESRFGFTERGDRLGFGRGYYDAWFRKNDPGLKIALSYEAQINANLPVEAHDVKVDIIVTEERIIRV
jgi:5-formyltetrahydrofolate cyclo-ligase